MTGKSTPQSSKIVLTDRFGSGPIAVDMESFFDFSFWIAEELEDLVAQMRHKEAAFQRPVIRDRTQRTMP